MSDTVDESIMRDMRRAKADAVFFAWLAHLHRQHKPNPKMVKFNLEQDMKNGYEKGSPERTYCTMVFECDMVAFDAAPHQQDTPFGKPVRIELGDSMEKSDGLELRVRQLEAELAALGKPPTP